MLEHIKKVWCIVTHLNCPDGVASAIILKSVLDNASVRWIQPDTKEHIELEPKPGMLFCDITPHESRLKEFIDAETIVLDHHKTGKHIVTAFGELGRFGDEIKNPGVCGAVLAFRHVYEPIFLQHNERYPSLANNPVTNKHYADMERLAVLAGIRDTWQINDQQWEDACKQAEGLMFWPFIDLRKQSSEDMKKMIFPVGKVLREKMQEDVKKANWYQFESLEGTKVAVLPSKKLVNDMAERLDKEVDLLVGFSYVIDGPDDIKLTLSTRSHADFDCASFCKFYGGGGHTRAAGCAISFDLSQAPNPFYAIGELVDYYEQMKHTK